MVGMDISSAFSSDADRSVVDSALYVHFAEDARARMVRREYEHTHPALERRQAVSAGVALRQRLQQRPGLLEVSGVKPLGEPAIDRCQELVGLGALALLLPQARQTHGRPQLPRFRLLAAGDGEGLLKMLLRFYLSRRRKPRHNYRFTSAEINRLYGAEKFPS